MVDSSRFRGPCLETFRLILRHIAYVAVAFFARVNNGNILTDGTDEGKYLQRKYNELYFFLFYIKYIYFKWLQQQINYIFLLTLHGNNFLLAQSQ